MGLDRHGDTRTAHHPRDQQPALLDMPDAAGIRERLQATLGDNYAIERELTGGGMAAVFVANDAALQRRVVVKVASDELAGPASVARFRRETLMLARLQHPNIVPVLSAGTVGDLPYFMMPF